MWKFLALVATVVVACSSGGPGDAGEPPGRPLNVRASLVGAGVQVTWAAPDQLDDEAIIQYLIGDGLGGLASAPGDALRVTLPKPPAGVIYEITVRVETIHGIGEPSDPIALTGRPGPVTAPHAPSAEAQRLRGFIEVVWLPPENDGGSLITTYVVHVEPAGPAYTFVGSPGSGYFLATNPSIRASASGDPATYSVVVPDLTPGERYAFRVTAENGIGKSEASELTETIVAGSGYGAAIPPVVSLSPGPIPPTRTPTPTPVPTLTPIPTPTSVLPTSTATSRPPSPTSVPPTPTPSPPTPTPSPPTATPLPTPTPVPTATPSPPRIAVTWTKTLFGAAGTSFRLSGVIAESTDPTEPVTVEVDWGDGVSHAVGFFDQHGVYDPQVFGRGPVFAVHSYAVPGTYTVTVRVTGVTSLPGETQFVVLIS